MPRLPQGIASARLKTKVAAAETPSPASMMTMAVVVVVVAGMYVAREVLIPITLAVLLSFVLAPLVARLRRLGLWRVPAVLLAVFVALSVITALGLVIGTQVAQLGRDAGTYAQTIERKVDTVRNVVTQQTTSLSSWLGRSEAPKPVPQKPGAAASAPKPLAVEVQQPDPTPFEIVERIAIPVLSPLGSLGIMLVVAIFILMQMEDLRDRMIRLFGSGDLHRTTAAMDDAASRLSRYFLAQLALNASFGVVVAVGLFFIGIPSPALFGIIAALFRFVPYVGAVGAAILPLLLAAGVDPGWSMVVETAGMFVIIEGITGQVLEPLAYGHSTGLSPVSVVVSAIFWAWLWGPIGLILSMPLTLCLVVLGRHVDHLQFIDVLLGDQPALTPAESFYQRMLAGDADEALDQAEVLLRDQPLSQYYDQVAMQGLHMAANDSLRGVLTPQQLDNIQEAINALVTELADHEDEGVRATPGPAGTVLCLAGRGRLDESACQIVGQVLSKRGLHARMAASGASSREAIDTLDFSDVGTVCISYLEAAGSISALRYLMRRVSARAPGVPIVVGLWQADPALLDEAQLKTTIGVDQYTTSLRDAVAACIHHAPHVAIATQMAALMLNDPGDDPMLAPA